MQNKPTDAVMTPWQQEVIDECQVMGQPFVLTATPNKNNVEVLFLTFKFLCRKCGAPTRVTFDVNVGGGILTQFRRLKNLRKRLWHGHCCKCYDKWGGVK